MFGICEVGAMSGRGFFFGPGICIVSGTGAKEYSLAMSSYFAFSSCFEICLTVAIFFSILLCLLILPFLPALKFV
jgi:hypothetical protein